MSTYWKICLFLFVLFILFLLFAVGIAFLIAETLQWLLQSTND